MYDRPRDEVSFPDNRPRRYLTGPQVCERYGGRSLVWLWRKLKADPTFPRPKWISRRRYFDEAEIEAYDAAPERSDAR